MKQKHVDDIVVALLAVNSYPATRVWELLPSLRDQGLLDVARVARSDAGEVVRRLKAGGYDRGKITEIVGPRLQTLMGMIDAGELDALDAAVSAGDRDAASRVLLGVPGIGPKVVETAWMLLVSSSAR